jgi:hypothetical protein
MFIRLAFVGGMGLTHPSDVRARGKGVGYMVVTLCWYKEQHLLRFAE